MMDVNAIAVPNSARLDVLLPAMQVSEGRTGLGYGYVFRLANATDRPWSAEPAVRCRPAPCSDWRLREPALPPRSHPVVWIAPGRGWSDRHHAHRSGRNEHCPAGSVLLAKWLRISPLALDGQLSWDRWEGLPDDSPPSGTRRARGIHGPRARFGQRRRRLVGRAAA